MANFDLTGRVSLQLDAQSLSKINSAISGALNKTIKKIAPNLGTEELKSFTQQVRGAAKAYEAFQERVRRADNLTKKQKTSFLRSANKAFRDIGTEEFSPENAKKQLKLLKGRITDQTEINKQIQRIRDLQSAAQDIADPKKRGGLNRSLNNLLGKVKSGSFIADVDGFQKVIGKVVKKLDITEDLQQTSKSNADAVKKFVDGTEDRFKQVRSLVSKVQRSSLSTSDKRNLLDGFLPDLFAKGTDQGRLREFRRGVEDFSNAVRAAEDAKKKADKIAKDQAAQARKNVTRVSPNRGSDTEQSGAFKFGEQSALAFKRFAAFSLSAGAVFGVVEAFRAGITEAISFEKELVKLAQVSNSSIASLKGTQDIITGLATSLGTSSKDLVGAAVTIRQAGFSIEETNAALETLALTSLSPSFNDIKNTTEGLIALRSQFGTTADQFKQQFGEINAVSKAFAVESEDIITAIRKSGGAFKVAGGNVRELIALFTAVRATTRESADTIATGFRTIFARLQRPQVLDELKSFNIELRDAQGNFVGPLKAIQAINTALSGVGQEGNLQFSRVAEQIGGIRQISKVIPLIQNFATAQRAANIAQLESNSLEADAEIAQQSLSNRLTKTREKFLEFARGLTINDQFKGLISGFLKLADSVTGLAKSIAPSLPTLALLFGLGQTGNLTKFAQGFVQRIGGGTTPFRAFGGLGAGIATSGLFGSELKNNKFALRRNQGLVRGLNAGIAAGATGLAIGGTVLGQNLASNPLQRNRFVAGRTIEGLSSGILGGALVGGPVGAAIGGAVVGLKSFSDALQEAQDALEESQFRPIFDQFTETISLINSGRLSPVGQNQNLNAGLQALRDRRLTATGVEREQLRGDIRQTVEALLLFQQTLLENVNTLDEFKEAGGSDVIKFIAENTSLTEKQLNKQAKESIDTATKLRQTLENANKTTDRLLSQTNLINAFGQALEDATTSINDSAQRFNFLANNAFGQGLGVRFRGTRGFGTATTNPNFVANSANQVSSIIGLPQFQDLASQASATARIRRELPSIISEFGIARPRGGVNEELDTFVAKRLQAIVDSTPGGTLTLQPVIDSITDALSAELATQGKGQGNAIESIIAGPLQFVDKIFGQIGEDQISKLVQQFGTSFTEATNKFAEQFAEITSNELGIRREFVSALQKQGGVLTEIAQRRDPRNFPIGQLRANRLNQANALLGRNAGAIGGSAANASVFIRNAGQLIRQKELDLQQAKSSKEVESLTTQIISLQGEVLAAKDAFDLLVDASDEVAAKFHEIDKIQLGRDQRLSGANQFFFGDRSTRNRLNQAAAAAQLAAINPDNFFNPNVIADSLRPVIGDFLEQFSELEIIPGLTGRQVTKNILQRGAQQRGAQLNNVNPKFLEDLREGPNEVQQKLLDEARALTDTEQANRAKFLEDQRKLNTDLNSGIAGSLERFINELRANLLKDVQASTQSRLDANNVDRANLQKQIGLFGLISGFGGSTTNNLSNQQVIKLAEEARNNEGNLKNAQGLLSDVSAFDNELLTLESSLRNRFKQNPIFNDLIRNTTGSVTSVAKGVGVGERVFDTLASDLQLTKTQKQAFRDDISEQIAGASLKGIVAPRDVRNIILEVLKQAAEASRNNSLAAGGKFAKDFGALGEDQQKFFDAVRNLPGDEFNKLSTAINELGDTKLDKVTEQFNKLNVEAGALVTTLQGLTGQINALNGGNGARQAVPPAGGGLFNNIFTPELQAVFQGITNGVSSFINGSVPLSQAMNNFPRSIEVQGNHKVEVTLNGAQVLNEMMPTIQKFVSGEIDKALQKFTLDTLPGALSYP